MSKLPLELLREKYIPVIDFPEKYGISVNTIVNLVKSHKIRYAEFKAPGDTRRSMHVNYEEVLKVLHKESN